MLQAFLGLAISLAYGLIAAVILYVLMGACVAQPFLTMYIERFNTLASLGLIAGTALIVGKSQKVIPATIEAAFTNEELTPTGYFEQKLLFYSRRRTVNFATEMIMISFLIFRACHFPLTGPADAFMMIAVCAQWALASYVGRKLRYAGIMLHSLLKIEVTRNLFKERQLDDINTAVHIASTLTLIWVYVHVRGSYAAPFRYDSFIGHSAQVFLLLPAVLAVPVLLIFTFLPREALRKIYNKSIDAEVKRLHVVLQSETSNPFEKRLYLMQFSKMCREELRYSLQLTLSDLPIAITIVVMLVEPIIKR